MIRGDQAMILRRLVLIEKLQAAGADRDIPDWLLTDLDDDELNQLAIKYGLEHYQIPVVRVR